MFWSMCPVFARPSGACWGFRCHLALGNTAIYCTAATGARKMALEPAQCHMSAPMGCSSPRSVPPEHSFLVPQDARSSCSSFCTVPQCAPNGCSSPWCPRNAQSGISNPYSVPQKRSSLLLCHRAFKKAFEEAVRRNGARSN